MLHHFMHLPLLRLNRIVDQVNNRLQPVGERPLVSPLRRGSPNLIGEGLSRDEVHDDSEAVSMLSSAAVRPTVETKLYDPHWGTYISNIARC